MFRALREAFDNCLPHTNTIQNWLTKIDGSPGFTASSFQVLMEKVHILKNIKSLTKLGQISKKLRMVCHCSV